MRCGVVECSVVECSVVECSGVMYVQCGGEGWRVYSVLQLAGEE